MFSVPYGKTHLEFDLQPGMHGHLADAAYGPPVGEVTAAVEATLAAPVSSPPLRELIAPGDRACVVFTDVTRASPDHLLVPPILRELKGAGVREEDITLVCGIGMHRPSTVEEKIAKLGQDVVDRYTVIDNEPQNPAALVDLGVVNGIPLSVHKAAYDADLLIATGIVEPHQYAGYSGGPKTVAVGAAGEALIRYSHGPSFMDDPNVRLGVIERNPFQEAIAEAALRAGLRFILNVVLDGEKRVLAVMAGEPTETHRRLVAFARSAYEVPIPQQYDVAVAGIGAPKDASLYHATRGPGYLYSAPTPVVRAGGYYIVPAPCQEGAGQGVGEQRFLRAMRDSPDVRYILEDGRKNGYPPGQQRAFVTAKLLEHNKVIIVGSQYPEMVAACKMIPADTVEEALSIAAADLGDELEVLVVPHSLLTLPVVQVRA
jgi:nickel-dependent lactate racemase